MTSAPNDGGPAFATAAPWSESAPMHQTGMSLRDYFATAALQGVLSDEDQRTWPKDSNNGETYNAWIRRLANERAEFCYLQADAMLSARRKP